MEVEVQHRHELLAAIDFIDFHVGAIDLDFVVRHKGQPEQVCGKAKYTVDDILQLEVGLQHLVVHVEQRRFVLFRIVGEIPTLDGLVKAQSGGEGLKFFHLLLRHRKRVLQQLVLEVIDVLLVFGHPFLQHVGSIGTVSEQLGDGVSQHEYLLDSALVVELAAESAGVVVHVQLLAQLAVVGVGEHGKIGRHRQVEQPAILPLGFCLLAGHGQCRFGNARKLLFISNDLGIGIDSIEHILPELQGEGGQAH